MEQPVSVTGHWGCWSSSLRAWCRLLVQQWSQARECCNASCVTRVLPLLLLLLLYSLHLLHLLHLLLMWFHDDIVMLLLLLLLLLSMHLLLASSSRCKGKQLQGLLVCWLLLLT